MEDVVFGIDEDGDADETDTEESGPGIVKITSPEDMTLLTDDQLFLVYLQPLLNLAATKIDTTCQLDSCSSTVRTTVSLKGSAIYLIWVRIKNKWLDDLWFYSILNSISVVSTQRKGNDEKLCSVGSCVEFGGVQSLVELET